MKKTVTISAVALINENHEILLTQRPEGKSLAGMWEFPGGKIEPEETADRAAVREMEEELGVRIAEEDLQPFTFISIEYEEFFLIMLLYIVKKWEGSPQSLEGQAFAWVAIEDLTKYPVPPADEPIIKQLQCDFWKWRSAQNIH